MKKLVLMSLVCVALTVSAQQHRLWYGKPASHWLEALPVGNSQLGAMVYGGTETEEIQLNEETFWSGQPHDNNSPEAKAHLQEQQEYRLMIGKISCLINCMSKASLFFLIDILQFPTNRQNPVLIFLHLWVQLPKVFF